MSTELLIDGVTTEELLGFPRDDLATLVFAGRPVVFRIGSAEILAEFERTGATATAVLAHIDGGGEGVLLKVFQVSRQIARKLAITRIDWVVAAVHCANPNLKLREMLVRLDFEVIVHEDYGDVYFRTLKLVEAHS